MMSENEWVVIEKVAGDLQAEILRGFLESQGIRVLLFQEGAGRALGLSVGPLGEVEILVPEESRSAAEKLLDNYYSGLYETDQEENPGDTSE
jgi:hypothetical protein